MAIYIFQFIQLISFIIIFSSILVVVPEVLDPEVSNIKYTLGEYEKLFINGFNYTTALTTATTGADIASICVETRYTYVKIK